MEKITEKKECELSQIPQKFCFIEYVMAVMDEREKRYQAKFVDIDKEIIRNSETIKEALVMATSNTKDALTAATNYTKDALATANTNINNLGIHISNQVDLAMSNAKEAVLKAELSTDKRFESVNAFRAQMADQQATLVRKTEVDLRFIALTEKVDTALAQLQNNAGQKSGTNVVWYVTAALLGLIIAASEVVIMFAIFRT